MWVIKIRLMICLISIFILSSCVSKQCPEPPPPEIVTKYKEVKVPVYKNPLDNITIQKPSQINKFYFSDNGTLRMSENAFKTMLKNFIMLKEERDYYFNILEYLE